MKAIELNLPTAVDRLLPNFICDPSANVCVTPCVVERLKQKGKKAERAYEFACGLAQVECGHEDHLSSLKCFCDIAHHMHQPKKTKFVFASEFSALRDILHTIPGVPVILFNRSVLVLESVSDSSKSYCKHKFDQRMSISPIERKALGLDKEEEPKQEEEKPKKKKGPKGPNPLSVKSKKQDEPKKPVEAKKKTRRSMKKKLTGKSDSNKDTVDHNDEIVDKQISETPIEPNNI
ncbi:hypothetical protein WA158_000995 [Blastocystis sp. Blastoise]